MRVHSYRHITRCLVIALVIGSLSVPVMAHAQDAWRTLPRDLWISASGTATGVQTISGTGSLGAANSGAGTAFRLGWGGDSSLAVFIGFETARLAAQDPVLAGDYTSRDFEVGARLQYPLTNHPKVVPFLEGAIRLRQLRAPLSPAGQAALGAQQSMQLNGWGGGLAGGIGYVVLPGVAIEGSAGVIIGPLTELRLDGTKRSFASVTAATTSLRLGLSLWPTSWWNNSH